MKNAVKFVMALAISLLLVGCAATSDSIRTMGTISNPDGSFEQNYSLHSRDAFGREILVVKSKTTKSVLNPVTKRYELQTASSVDGQSAGGTWEHDGVAAFVGNLPNAAGDIFGAWVLRGADWGTTINNDNSNFNLNKNYNKNFNDNLNFNFNNNKFKNNNGKGNDK